MSNDGKKISFSFSKVKKSSLVNKVNTEPKEKVDYVDCFDGSKGKFSFRGNIKNDDASKKELVIPLINTSTYSDIIKSRLEEKKNKTLKSSETLDSEKGKSGDRDSEKSKTLEEQAAAEILSEIQNGSKESQNVNKLIIEANGLPLSSTTEVSEADIDYDNIPVSDFGLAMLRGMGWKQNTGIGKEPRMVPTVSPKLRPRGLGLGAEQTSKQKNEDKKNSKEKKAK